MSSPLSKENSKKEIENFRKNYELKDFNLELASDTLIQLKSVKTDNSGVIIKCAIFITLKQQINKSKTLKEKNDMKLQCDKFVKEAFNDSFPGFITFLKEISDLNIFEPEISNDLKSLIIKFSFSHKFFMKYDKIFQSIEWLKKGNANFSIVDYLKCLKKIGWTVFINTKTVILKNRSDIVGSTCLLVLTIHFIIEKSQDFMQTKADFICFDSSIEILNSLLKYFHIQDAELFKNISAAFYECLSTSLINVCDSKNFNPSCIFSNLKNTTLFYLKNLGLDDFDESIFLNEKNLSSPSKFTPFSKQGIKNQLKNHFAAAYNYKQDKNTVSNTGVNQTSKITIANQQLNCQRILNYDGNKTEVETSNNTNSNIINNNSQLKFLKNIPASPYTAKGLPISTPMTAAIEMYNWLHDIYNKWKQRSKESNYSHFSTFQECDETLLQSIMKKNIEPLLDKILDLITKNQCKDVSDVDLKRNMGNPQNYKIKENKYYFIIALYLKFLEKIQNENLGKDIKKSNNVLYNENYHIGILICCMESAFFILNINEISFMDLMNKSQIDVVKLWECFNDFIRFDILMPTPLKLHLLDIEIKIVSCYVWRNGSSLLKIIKNYFLSEQENLENLSLLSNEVESEKENKNKINLQSKNISSNKPNLKSFPEYDLIFKRIISQCAYQIYQIMQTLNIHENLSEHVWSTMKYIFTCEPQMMMDRHVDQLILCNLYGVCKIFQIPIKFQDIIVKYQEFMSNDKQQQYEVIYNVNLNNNQNGDIITFYNNVFISTMKSFIVTLNKKSIKSINDKSQTPQIKNPLISRKIIDSPLASVLPSGLQHIKKTGNQKNPIMTPKTHMLYAFAESPLMKINDNNLKNTLKSTIHSKKLIDFEETHNGGKNEITIQKNFNKYENEQLSKIDETVNENALEKQDISFMKNINMKLISKNELAVKTNQNITPEKNRLFVKTQTPRNDTQKFLKNLSNIQESNKTPTNNKNKFIRLNFDNVAGNIEKN